MGGTKLDPSPKRLKNLLDKDGRGNIVLIHCATKFTESISAVSDNNIKEIHEFPSKIRSDIRDFLRNFVSRLILLV